MDISKLTSDDAIRCANLAKLLANGRWDLTGSNAEELVRVKKWVHDLAMQMAAQLKPQAPTAKQEPQTMKVKAMGALPPSKSSQKKK